VTREEREALIELLKTKNAASLAELERRAAERAAARHVVADFRFTRERGDLIYTEPVESPKEETPTP
jgi:hypothetical protein